MLNITNITYMEVVTFPLEFSRGVNLVSHNPGDGLNTKKNNIKMLFKNIFQRERQTLERDVYPCC